MLMIKIYLLFEIFSLICLEILKSTNIDRNKLGVLFTIILEYLSSNSTNMDDKLVSQISFLMTIQVELKH